MFKESAFENLARGFSSSEIQGPKSTGRPVEIVRFEIPWNALTVNITLHFLPLKVKF